MMDTAIACKNHVGEIQLHLAWCCMLVCQIQDWFQYGSFHEWLCLAAEMV